MFIAERLNVGKLLYHRTCFRCARCKSQLSLANYYETENGEFCCEICPDEERAISKKVISESVLNRSLSDEEKTANLQNYADAPDAYSTHFETALEYTLDADLKKNSTLSGARSNFFQSQLDSSSESEVETIPPVKPKPPLSPKPNLEFLLTSPRIPSDNNSFPISSTKNNSNSVSVSEQTNDRFVTKDNPSSPTGMSVRARMKLFENDKEDKSDVNNTSRSSSEAHLVTKKATVIAIDDLEDFDNISNKKNFEVESHLEALEENTEAHSVIDEEQFTLHLNKSISDSSREIVEPPEATHSTIEDSPIENKEQLNAVEDKNIQFESHITLNLSTSISDSSHEIVEPAEASHITISDEASHITIEDSSVENKELSRQTQEDSFQSVKTNNSCTTESSEDVPTRGYYTAYEIPSSPIPEGPESSVSSEPQEEHQQEIQTPSKEPEYPDELNPFDEENTSEASDANISHKTKPVEVPPTPGVRTKKKLIPVLGKQVDTPTSQVYVHRISKNPFDDEDLSEDETAPSSSYNPFDEEEDDKPEEKIVPAPRKKVIPAFREASPKGYNPFEEDEDEPEEEIRPVPVPTPRLSK